MIRNTVQMGVLEDEIIKSEFCSQFPGIRGRAKRAVSTNPVEITAENDSQMLGPLAWRARSALFADSAA